jgi:hypothetical protein
VNVLLDLSSRSRPPLVPAAASAALDTVALDVALDTAPWSDFAVIGGRAIGSGACAALTRRK